VVLRSRFTEDRLKQAVARGVSQYVILGAGYDTFIARQPDWARALRVVEVDAAATQAEKRSRLEAAQIAVPANVVFVGFDFREGTFIDALRRHGVTTAVPTFFSWLGVTMYLTETAIDATLAAVAQFPTGSEIVLTFAPRAPADSPGILATLAAAAGEPWLSYFEPAALEQKLRGFGLNRVEFLTPEEATRLYYQTRADALPPPRRTSIVSAQK
jgi:methyltransferase (TIGR00027 family)